MTQRFLKIRLPMHPKNLNGGFLLVLPMLFNKSRKSKRSIGVIPAPQIYSNKGHIFRSDAHVSLQGEPWENAEFSMRPGYVFSEKGLTFFVDNLDTTHRIDHEKLRERIAFSIQELIALVREMRVYYDKVCQRRVQDDYAEILATDEGRTIANSIDLLDKDFSVRIDRYSDTAYTNRIAEKLDEMQAYLESVKVSSD